MKRGLRMTYESHMMIRRVWEKWRETEERPTLVSCLAEYVAYQDDAILLSEITGEDVYEFSDEKVCQILERTFRKHIDEITKKFSVVTLTRKKIV